MTDRDPIHCPITEVVDIAPDTLAALTPLLEHLQSNQVGSEPTTFPRGTVLADGRLDLCKQQLGPTGCRLVTETLAANATNISLLLGTNAIGAADVALRCHDHTALLLTSHPWQHSAARCAAWNMSAV